MAVYHQMKERIDMEQQAQLDIPPSNEEAPAANKSSSTTQLSRNTVDKVPSLKKKVTLNPEPIFPKLETALASSLPKKLEKEGIKPLPPSDKLKEAAKLTSTRMDTPSDPAILKETVSISTIPVFSRFKPAPSSSVQEELRKESEKVEKKMNTIKSKTVLSEFKMTPSFSTSDEIGKERGKKLPTTSETRETKEKILSETFSLKTILESLPRRKKLLTDSFKEKRGFNANDLLLIEKKWRSKHWKSYQHITKSKVVHGNKHYSIERFRGWVFVEEMVFPCLLRDNMPFVNALEGFISDSSPQLDDQEKLEDAGVTHSKNENGSKNAESTKRSNKIPFSAPAGQVMKIAIMVGFGLLVILTRQKK